MWMEFRPVGARTIICESIELMNDTDDAPPASNAAGPVAADIGRRISVAVATISRIARSTQGLKILRASGWTMVGYTTSTGLRALSRIVLAKLLTNAVPIGNAAVVVTILTGVEMVSELGIGNKIIQHGQGADPKFLKTAFSVQVLRAALLWAITTAAAYPVARFYRDPALAGLLLFGATSVLIRGFTNPGIWTLSRQVQLRTPIMLGFSAEIVGFAVTMGWMFIQPSAWPLIAGTVATALAYTICSHFAGARSGFAWDRKVAEEIMTFGGWTILSTGTWFLCTRGETLMLKGSIPDIEFGCLAFATLLVQAPLSAINQLGTQVYYPMMASWLREDEATSRRQFRRGKWVFTAVAVCVVSGAIVVGPVLVRLLHLNKTYASLTWMVQILGFRAAQETYGTPSSNLLLASGELRYSAAANVVRLAVLVLGLWITLPIWGLQGAIWVLVSAPLISYLVLVPGVRRHMPGAVALELQTLSAFIGGTLAVAALYLALSK
jgi:O-antigen/teichoic acid export membrane protein